MTGGDVLGSQADGVIQKGFEFNLCVTQNIGVGCPPRLVLSDKFSEDAVFVLGRKVNVFNLNADHVCHSGRIDKVNVAGAVGGVIVVFPILHEDADHFMPLLLQ